MEITAATMSRVMNADITAVAQEPIGDGLVGLNLRVALSSPDDVPDSVVIKLPSLDELSRATGVGMRNYEREVKFYDHIASTVDIRVPHCFHSEWDSESGDFALVLEDMAPAEQGDQITGCDLERAADAVRELARLHGPRWNDPALGDYEFLGRPTGAEDGAQLTMLWELFEPGFLATYSQYLSDESVGLVRAFGPLVSRWIDGRDDPISVTHGDYRLDNLLFGTAAGGPPVTAVDWQTPGHGSPIADVSYFCGAGLLPEDRRAHEHDLLTVYIDALGSYEVEVDESWVFEQYRRESFAGVLMALVASQVVGTSERSEAMFAAMASRHLQHCLDLDAIDAV